MQPIRVLLVDDNVKFLEAVSNFLSQEPQIEISGQAVSGCEALEKADQLKPDLILIDLVLPDISGLEITKRLKAESNPPCIIMLTMHDQLEYRNLAETLQVDGFIGKADVGMDLLSLIDQLFADYAAKDYVVKKASGDA